MERKVAYMLTAILFFTFFPALSGSSENKTIVKYDRDSRYYRIIVVDYPEKDRRVLYFSKTRGAQSIMILSSPDRLGLAYLRSMIAALPLNDNPKDILLVGLGGASLPKFLSRHYPELHLDIVEIDPDVIKVAQNYFDFKISSNVNVFAMDGRMFLKHTNRKYDVIFLDAYTSDSLPFHLTTVEFYRLVRDHLNPGGVVAVNLWEYYINRFLMSKLKTVQTVFPQSHLFTTPDAASKVLFATLTDRRVTRDEWAQRAVAFVGERDIWYSLPELVNREYEYIADKKIEEKLLTDDMAPVDLLRMQPAGR